MNHQRTVNRMWLSGSYVLAMACATVSSEPPGSLDSNSGGADNGGTNSVGATANSAGISSTGGSRPTSTTVTGTGGANNTGGSLGNPTSGGSRAMGGSMVLSTIASIALPYTDDFESGNPNMWINWNSSTSALGSWAVAADGTNHVLQQSNSGSSATYDVGGDVKWTDQKFSVKVRWGNTGTYIYVSARFNNPDGYYYFQAVPGSKPKLRVRNGGSTTDVCAGTANFAGVAGTWYTVTVTAQGSTISVDIDGTAICSGSSTAIAAGGIAVGTDGGPAAFDDVSVTAP